jgi:hypothetical protein
MIFPSYCGSMHFHSLRSLRSLRSHKLDFIILRLVQVWMDQREVLRDLKGETTRLN